MPAHLLEEPSVLPKPHAGEVHVSSSTRTTGWDVTATIDGRIVAHRHCDDWHRVERARAALLLTVRRHLRHLAERTLLLLVLSAAAAPFLRWTPVTMPGGSAASEVTSCADSSPEL